MSCDDLETDEDWNLDRLRSVGRPTLGKLFLVSTVVVDHEFVPHPEPVAPAESRPWFCYAFSCSVKELVDAVVETLQDDDDNEPQTQALVLKILKEALIQSSLACLV
ncbi:hypothetical protein M0R45_035940 [Rubus argutus]|uniref:Uncharacterized protein n=1 Tax=Rubus argutus TaxID=59490 RepID=A0AAW1VWE7_RUBAR